MLKINKVVAKVLALIMVMSGVSLMGCKARGANLLDDVKDYRIYYRSINEDILADMEKYDAVIVESLQFTAEQVKRLKDKGVKVFGYLSVTEIGSWDKAINQQLIPEDLLWINGVQIKVGSNSQSVGDIRQTHFQDILIKEIENRIILKGMDGVFFDTIDYIDYYSKEKEIGDSLKEGYLDFLNRTKETYQDLYIIQNRGFEVFQFGSYKYVDALLWENFVAPSINNSKSAEKRVNEIQKICTKNGLKVLAVSYDNEEKNKSYAEKLGWIFLYHGAGTSHNVWMF